MYSVKHKLLHQHTNKVVTPFLELMSYYLRMMGVIFAIVVIFLGSRWCQF